MKIDYYVKREGKFYRVVEENEEEICVVSWFAYADGTDREQRMWWWKKNLDKEPEHDPVRPSVGE